VDRDDELFAGILRWERTWQLMLVISPRWRAAQAHRHRQPLSRQGQGITALNALADGEGDDPEVSDATLAKSLGVSAADVTNARNITQYAPDLIEGVMTGAPFSIAARLARKRRAEAERSGEQLDDLADAG
jgi:hypothetical protein